jgi:hypothetical protein
VVNGTGRLRAKQSDRLHTGTAFVISQIGDRALMLTAWHCDARPGDAVEFPGDGEAPTFNAEVRRVVRGSAHPDLEYALVEVRLPEGIVVEPLPTANSVSRYAGATVYNVGFPDLNELEDERRLPAGRWRTKVMMKRLWGRAPRDMTLQWGVGLGSARHLNSACKTKQVFDFPVLIRQSGSPVVDRETHLVIGLTTHSIEWVPEKGTESCGTTQRGHQMPAVTPLPAIQRDVRRGHWWRRLTFRENPLVTAWLKRARAKPR